MILQYSLLILIHLFLITIIQIDGKCPINFVPCLNSTDCISLEKVCLSDYRCVDSQGHSICKRCGADAGDTLNCVTRIEPEPLFECISPNQICDGQRDCVNNQDEIGCEVDKCPHDSWLCANHKCIKKELLCNSRHDCTDGSDEGDFCHSHICGANKFRCRTGECISQEQICDGSLHCPNGDDEDNCLHLSSTTVNDSCSIPSNTFVCSSSIHSICLSPNRLCDGYGDCPKGDDEINCNQTCSSNGICSNYVNVKCIQHPAGNQLCRCEKQGYQLTISPIQTNTQICQDFNECKDSLGIYCSFACENTDGSYNCTCPTGYSSDYPTKTCRKNSDPSKADVLIQYDDNISLYNLLGTNNQYSLKLSQKIIRNQLHRFDHIQYDPIQSFILYYDSYQHTIFCQSSTNLKTLILIPNITIDNFAYNANERTLFLLEKISQTLRVYTPIVCEISRNIQMHSWLFATHFNQIQSMTIDVEHRQLLFVTKNELLISNISKPNSTGIIYSSERDMKQILYDNTFKRMFWTTVNKTHADVFMVHTCQNEFKKCFDTAIALPTSGPFAFFNDGLLYVGSSRKSLDFVQIYGKNRFADRVVTSTDEQIHTLLRLNDQSTPVNNLCMESASQTRCKNQLCLQVNATDIQCLSIDANFLSTGLTTSNNINSNLLDQTQALLSKEINSPVTKKERTFFYRPWTKILFSIIGLSIFLTIIAFFVKRYQQRLNHRAIANEQHPTEGCLTRDEPTLDEFNIVVDDRNYDRLPLTNQLQY